MESIKKAYLAAIVAAIVIVSAVAVYLVIKPPTSSGSTGGSPNGTLTVDPRRITVRTTNSTYRIASGGTSGWFHTGQNADIMLSGIDFNNAGGPLLFNRPTGIASDGTHLLLADTWNNRILIWNSPPTSNVPPDLVLGQESFYTNNPGTGPNQLNWPMGVSTDGQHVVVADTNNDRILIWNTFPTRSGQPADLVIQGQPVSSDPKIRIDWPWGIWTDGKKLVVSSTSTASVLIWNTFPTQNNQPADIFLTGQGMIGTPRNITSDGTHLIVGDHNPNVAGVSGQGNFFWSSFPEGNDQLPTFFMSDPTDARGAWMRGVFTPDDKLVLLGVKLYVWNSFPRDKTQAPDSTIGRSAPGGTEYWFKPAEGAGVALAGGRLYLTSENKIICYNSLPTRSDAKPDFAVGGPDINTNTLDTYYFITNPNPVSDGKSLFVSSDSGKLYVWKALPDQSGAKPDIVYDLPYQPWASVLFKNTYVLAGKDAVLVWNSLPRNGEMPDVRFERKIGNATLQDLKGVALDDRYFYLADRDANKIYVWEGMPKNTTNPKFTISIKVPTRLSSDGTYLVAASTEDPNSNERIKFYRIDQLSSSAQPTFLTGVRLNLPESALAVNGRLFVADTGFNRVLVWDSIEDAVAGKAPNVVLGEEGLDNTVPEIGVNKLFMPSTMSYDGSYLWVGEFKFSGRVLRFSPS